MLSPCTVGRWDAWLRLPRGIGRGVYVHIPAVLNCPESYPLVPCGPRTWIHCQASPSRGIQRWSMACVALLASAPPAKWLTATRSPRVCERRPGVFAVKLWGRHLPTLAVPVSLGCEIGCLLRVVPIHSPRRQVAMPGLWLLSGGLHCPRISGSAKHGCAVIHSALAGRAAFPAALGGSPGTTKAGHPKMPT